MTSLVIGSHGDTQHFSLYLSLFIDESILIIGHKSPLYLRHLYCHFLSLVCQRNARNASNNSILFNIGP